MAVAAETSTMECEMSIKTLVLEKEYERTLADSARLLDAERDRMRCMEHLLIRCESDALRSQLDQAHTQLLGFTQSESEALLQLEEACQEIDRLDGHAWASSKEIERLKGEICSVNSTSSHYNSLLAEKVQLSRELASLKSDMDRLKTQKTSDQASITGKHELERQLNSLEVQLDNEKHAHERVRAKCAQQSAEITKLSSKIEELQGELAREQRAKQQYERDSRQQSVGWDSQRAVLEGRIETLRKQLRSAKDKLQEAQHDLQQRRGNLKIHHDGPEPQSRAVPLQRPGRSSEQGGVTIATPGAVRVQAKPNRKSALPGDKSAFSITPYLNRTGASRDSPISSDMDEEEVKQAMQDTHLSPGKNRVTNAVEDPESLPKDRPAPARVGQLKGGKVKSKGEQARSNAPDPITENSKPASRSAGVVPIEEPDEFPDTLAEPGQVKPKRRKLGAQRDRGLFEDEDEMLESRKPARKLALGASRNSVLTSTQTGASAGDRLPRTLGFGAFSPLKRDRKR